MNETVLAIPTRRKLNLAAVLDAPNVSGTCPFVILLHGRTGWKEEEHISSLAQGLSKQGIAALRFDAPGSGGSEGSWASDYRISTYVEALLDVYAFAVRNLAVDPGRFGLWAHSMGGLIAVRAAGELRGLRAFCGCEISTDPGITDPQAVDAWRETGWREEQTEHFGIIHFPYAFHEDRVRQSELASVKDLQCANLFIAGTHDDIVPAKDVYALFEAANEPKQYHEFPIDHLYKRVPARLAEVNELALGFFRQTLQ